MKDIVLLVGGKGTRLKHLTKKTPKCLIQINNKPFLYYLLKQYENSKCIKNIFLCSQYKSLQIKNFIKGYKSNSLNIKIINDGNISLGTGGSIKKIINYLSEDFFVQNGDTFLNVNYDYLSKIYYQNSLSLICYSNFISNKLECPNLRTKGNIIKSYSKKNVTNNNSIDAGLYIFNKKNFEKINKSDFDLSIVIQKLIQNKYLAGYKIKRKFYEIGSFKGIDEFSKKLKYIFKY